MTISYSWLLQYLPEELPLDELCTILTSIGLEVEGVDTVEVVKGSLKGLVIGEVLTCEKHPDADKLKVTTVNIGGDEPLNIVCGAPNVAAGQKVVVAPVGSHVHPTGGDAFPIKKAKIRGVASHGMICAEDEIGLGNGHDGIMVLDDTATVGVLAKDFFDIPQPDYAIHIGLTPNRSDAMSHIGTAKDVCAYLTHHKGKKYEVVYPEVSLPEAVENRPIKVNIHAEDTCLRYMGLTVSNVTVAPSPDWLRQKLEAIGVRSINNIVDITNYVLHEWGQPLHAFDADKIEGEEINVKFLPQDTSFTTLDDTERKLRDADLMICDKNNGLCIAGVFGGATSGVTDATTTVFLESAYFDAMHVRRTSMHHDLRTDAATHFEKGVDINALAPALKRAAAMMVTLAGGQIASEISDNYPKQPEAVKINVAYEYVRTLSGKDYSNEAIKNVLIALGFAIDAETEKSIEVTVPTNKPDVLQPADIVEEVLRIDGLDNIKIPERLNISLNKPMPNDRAIKNKLADVLAAGGFYEIVTNSIVNSKYYAEREDLVRMLNSLTSELDVLRPSMLESGLEVMQYNYNRKQTDLTLFEFGKVYTQVKDKYVEEEQLVLYATGNATTQGWNQKPQAIDIYYLKAVVEKLIQDSGINKVKLSYKDGKTVWSWKKKTLCTLEEVAAKKASAFDVKQPVYTATILWATWLEAMAVSKVQYKEVPKYPTVYRDLAIVLDKSVAYNEVEQVTTKLNIPFLQTYGLFDIFESEKIGADKKSLALNYSFQLEDRTLTDAEVDKVMQQLIDAYKKQLNAQIRE